MINYSFNTSAVPSLWKASKLTPFVEKDIIFFIKDSEDEYLTMQDRGLAWEMIKLKIRAFSVPYCVKKNHDRQAFKINLEKDSRRN